MPKQRSRNRKFGRKFGACGRGRNGSANSGARTQGNTRGANGSLLVLRRKHSGRKTRVAQKSALLLRTPKTVEEALDRAEHELSRATTVTVLLTPAEITTRPELFQPRASARTDALDPGHVRKLAKRIENKGELDPPLVIKIGKKWVCVDGHHRIAAYLKQPNGGWKGTIRCDWFPGTVREAVDESLRRNEVVKLEMKPEDRFESAWQRVVLEWGSKRDIKRLTGVSDGLIGEMRRIKTAYELKDEFGREFRKKLGRPLTDASWSLARNAYLNISPAEYDEKKEAAKLAKYLTNRMEGRLSKNPRITALALAIYDPTLPEPLASELRKVNNGREAEEAGDDIRPINLSHPTEGELTTEELLDEFKQLKLRQEQTEWRIRSIERTLKAEGVNPPTSWTSSDETWERWTKDADKDQTA